MSKYQQLSADGNAVVAKLEEISENQEYILGELETISSYLNELLDLQFSADERKIWLEKHADDRELRESEEE